MLLTDVVTYASVMTKMSLASPSISWGCLGGPQGSPRGAPQGQTKTWSNQIMLLIVVVTYASVMTKMCSASSRDPPGALGGPKGLGGSHHVFAISTNVTNRCCQICFSDDKNVFGIITRPLLPRGFLCFSDDKNEFGVTPDPLGGPSECPRGLRGLHQ